MKFLTYRKQLALSILLVLVGNVLNTVFDHWIYRSIGFAIAGILWILHPVVLPDLPVNPKTIRYTRIAGVILILIAIFTRAYG